MLPREEDITSGNGCTITLTDTEAKAFHSLREVIQQEIKNVVSNEHETITESDVEEMITTAFDSELEQYITDWCDNYLDERVIDIIKNNLTISVEVS